MRQRRMFTHRFNRRVASLRSSQPQVLSAAAKRPLSSSSFRASSALYDVDDHNQEATKNLRQTPRMPTPGLMFVTSRVLDAAKTSDEKYNRFYNEEHLPDVLKYNVSKVAFRYKNNNQSSDRPYLALYPLGDAAYLQSPDLGKLVEDTRKSKTFDGDDIYNHLHFDLRPYEKIQTFEGYGHETKTGDGRGQTIICVAMEPANGEDADFDEWYRKQHLDMLAMCRGYRRTTRYKRLDGTTPRYLALHEYACAPSDVPGDQIKQVVSTEWSKRIIAEARAFDRDVFELIQAQGETSLKL